MTLPDNKSHNLKYKIGFLATISDFGFAVFALLSFQQKLYFFKKKKKNNHNTLNSFFENTVTPEFKLHSKSTNLGCVVTRYEVKTVIAWYINYLNTIV